MKRVEESVRPGHALRRLTCAWFLFLTSYRRRIKSMPAEIEWVRGRLDQMLRAMEAEAGRDPKLEFQLRAARFPLVYFADEVLLNCRWGGESAWARDLLETQEFGTQHAGQDFFARLCDPALSDPEILEVYLTCLCLGFRGCLLRKPLELREVRDGLAVRLGCQPISGPRLCPEAYAHTERREFVKLPVVATLRIGLACGLIVLGAYLVAGRVFAGQVEALRKGADTILNKSPASADAERGAKQKKESADVRKVTQSRR